MKKSPNLPKIRNNMLNKIRQFFENLFYPKKEKLIGESFKPNIQAPQNEKEKNDFKKDIKVNEAQDRVAFLKQKFDNKMIDVREISMKDKMELLERYKKEILEIRNIGRK